MRVVHQTRRNGGFTDGDFSAEGLVGNGDLVVEVLPCVEVAIAGVRREVVVLRPSVDYLAVGIPNDRFTALGGGEVECGSLIGLIFQRKFEGNLVIGLGFANANEGDFGGCNFEAGLIRLKIQLIGAFESFFRALHKETSFDQAWGREKLIGLASTGSGIGNIRREDGGRQKGKSG